MKKTEQYEYSLEQIYFYLTEGCNLACRHCWIVAKDQSKGYNSYLDLELFHSILEQAIRLGLYSVKLTGGEPLLHPQIIEILDLICKENLRVVVETNGILCTSEIIQKIAACKDPFVSVSLDGANAKTHEQVRGREGSFEAAVQAIRNLVKEGLPCQIIMTLMRCNREEIEEVVYMAESLGVDSVKFNIVQPTARGEEIYQAGEGLEIEELIRLGQWVQGELSNRRRLRLYYSYPLAFHPLGKIFGRDKSACGVCRILHMLGVLADGSYAMCGIGESMPGLIYGHAGVHQLKDVWKKTPVIQQLREGLPNNLKGVCSSCVMKSLCLGSCIAQNYYRSGDLWAPFWFCEEAYQKGLFPKTRLTTSYTSYLDKRHDVLPNCLKKEVVV